MSSRYREICFYFDGPGSVLSWAFNCLVIHLFTIADNLADGQREHQSESKEDMSENVDDVLK
jgi:hypothetical protein